MLFLAAISVVLYSASLAQECSNLKACIDTQTALCGDGNPESGGGADWEAKRLLMTCIKAKLTESGFDFEKSNSNSQSNEELDDKCHPREIFEACGIEAPERDHRGGKKGGRPRGEAGAPSDDGANGDRRGHRGGFGPKNNAQEGEGNQGGRGHHRGPKGGHHGHFKFLKGCGAEIGGEDANPPTDGPRCHRHAVHQCMKDNRAEIQAAVTCSLPEEREEPVCDPQVALAIDACKAE